MIIAKISIMTVLLYGIASDCTGVPNKVDTTCIIYQRPRQWQLQLNFIYLKLA